MDISFWLVSSSVTPVLDFDNADLQSLVTAERPDLVGNPYAGVCPNGARVGAPSCWFNPGAFAVPPAGQFNNTQSPRSLGGNGDAVFKDAAGNFAANAGQILTTAGAARQVQLAGRFMPSGFNGSCFSVPIGDNPRWAEIRFIGLRQRGNDMPFR